MTEASQDLEDVIAALTRRARQASRLLARLDRAAKDAALRQVAEVLGDTSRREALIEANARDLEAAREKGLSAAMVDRLALDASRIDAMRQGLAEVADLPDPVGVERRRWTRPNGLEITKRTIPLGVIGIIYESRPNVTVDAFSLCFKAGNATVLKGGSEAIHSNRALVKVISEVLEASSLGSACQLLDFTDRAAVTVLLQQEEDVDLIIPRGGEGLIRFVSEHSRIPVIKHYKGVCHVFVDAAADLDMALEVAVNAKLQRPGVCNAMETLLVHADVAERFLPRFAEATADTGLELRGDARTRELVPRAGEASDDDYHAEFLDRILAVRVVEGLDQAVGHIEQYGSSHTEAIVTADAHQARRFVDSVGSSVVMVNASTRFADGGELGLGAEIGISTTRLHAYGPMGLESLVTERFVVEGAGQVRK